MRRPDELDLECPECGGEGEAACLTCGTEGRCCHCEETGWDPDQVDIPAYRRAVKVLNLRRLASARGLYVLPRGVDVTDYLL